MRNNETDACKICRKLSEDKDSPQCEYKNMSVHEPYEVLRTACLSKDRAILVLLNELVEQGKLTLDL